MSHANFARLALAQDIKNAKATIENLKKALAGSLSADARDFCERDLVNQTKRLAVLRNTNPCNY